MCCLLPEMPFPLLILYSSAYLSSLLEGTRQLQAPHPPCTPTLHALPSVTSYQPVPRHVYGISPSLGGQGGVTHLCAPTQCRVHSGPQHVCRRTNDCKHMATQSYKTGQNSLGMTSGCFLPLQSDRGLVRTGLVFLTEIAVSCPLSPCWARSQALGKC